MDAVVKYLRFDSGIQDNAMFLDRNNDEIIGYDDAVERSFVKKGDKGVDKIVNENILALIPYAVNNDYQLHSTVYCFDKILVSGLLRRGFFATLQKIDGEKKEMFGIQPLIIDIESGQLTDKLYWSNEVVNVLGSLHIEVKWIKAGDKIKVSRVNCGINTQLRVSTNLKVMCPTCGDFHPQD